MQLRPGQTCPCGRSPATIRAPRSAPQKKYTDKYTWGRPIPLTTEATLGLIRSWTLTATTLAADRKADPDAYQYFEDLEEEEDDYDDLEAPIKYACWIVARPVSWHPCDFKSALRFASPKLPGLTASSFHSWLSQAWRQYAEPVTDEMRPAAA